MDTVTLSPRFKVVIPQSVRKHMNLKPGEKFQVISFENRIELIPTSQCLKCGVSLKDLLQHLSGKKRTEYEYC